MVKAGRIYPASFLISRITDDTIEPMNIPNQRPHISYLCLQISRPGQASYAHVHEIIKGLQSAGYQVSLIQPSRGEKIPGWLMRLVVFATAQIRLITHVIKNKSAVVYVRAHPLAWFASAALRIMGVPVVQECNGMIHDPFIAWPITRYGRRLFIPMQRSQYRMAQRCIVGSTGLGNWIERFADVTSEVIPNGANHHLFKPTILDASYGLHKPYVVFFGALSPWQGLSTSLKAVVHEDWPSDVDLVVIGDGIERSMVLHAVSNCSRIRYLGTQPYENIPALVSNAICSLVNKEQPEFAEAGISPLKLYESMSCGTPVIATYGMPGLTEVVAELGCGVLVHQGSVEDLIAAVQHLLDSPEKAHEMGVRGREYIDREGSWEARARQTADVIARVLDLRDKRKK